MRTWTAAALQTWRFWMGGPHNDGMLWFLLFIGMVTMVLTLQKAAKAAGAQESGSNRALLCAIITFLMATVATIAADIYLAPSVSNSFLVHILPIAVPLLTCVLIAAPFCCVVLRANYIQALISVAVGILAAALVVLLLNGGMRMVQHGGDEFRKTRRRTESLNQML